MNYRVGIECGQRFFSLHSWRISPRFRKLPYSPGFAVGPVMFWKDE